jgi:hypothetical protein
MSQKVKILVAVVGIALLYKTLAGGDETVEVEYDAE